MVPQRHPRSHAGFQSLHVGRFALLAACFFPGIEFSRAASVTLNPVADTFLSATYTNNNFGGLLYFNSGTTQNNFKNRGLLRFDIASAIPAGAKIKSANLIVECVGSPPPNENPPPSRLNLHRALRSWGEGSKISPTNCSSCSGQGSAATTNEATWFNPFAFTTNLWATPGGAAGTDFVATASSGVTIYTENESPYTMASTAQLVTDVQLWLDQPQSNFGWFVVCQLEATNFTARRIGSREDTNNAPKLEISYLIAPKIEKIQRGAGQFTLWFTAEPEQGYQIQYAASLPGTNWQTLATFGPPPATTLVAVVDAVAAPQRFYRILSY